MTTATMTPEAVKAAVYEAWVSLGRCNVIDAAVKHEVCRLLGCDPHQLDAALTDEVVGWIFFG